MTFIPEGDPRYSAALAPDSAEAADTLPPGAPLPYDFAALRKALVRIIEADRQRINDITQLLAALPPKGQ